MSVAILLAIAFGMLAAPTSAAPVIDGGVSRAHPDWAWPVDGVRTVVRPFAAPPSPYAAGHRGVDLAAPGAGAVVRAATHGVVHFAGTVVDRPVVTVRSGHLLVTVEPVEPSVEAGDWVRAGDAIGLLQGGHCAATPCVHLGVRVDGEYVSPLLYLGGLRRAVLLPLSAHGE
ncbi:membrane protein [Microcella alkaliphila]|jgi:murein DD-endopeptidase MepM/ murein hydrolase activator NlpD|uniref:Membrane protein n=2 Tax=Microcella alkaliphila TaxID=279828 RepID=A0A0U5BIF2_9MICO|nr:membrane protein [Microcella alkaliphila]